ncbi:hypothetical protein D3C84_765100 [compost metagenome]
MIQLQGDAPIVLLLKGHLIPLLAQFPSHFLTGRLDHFTDKARHVRALWHHGDITQASLPATERMGGVTRRRERLVTQALTCGIQVQGTEQTPDRRQENDRERQCTGNGRGLQSLQPIGQQQCYRYHTDAH